MNTFYLINILQLLAGIGLFLFAMHLLEESLKNISGRNFKIFLQRITKNRIGAAAGGTVVTAILQSSSMVLVMVLAFVGAGVFSMNNAMAITLGANLGTTLDSWLVASLGFKVNIEIAAYPAVCAGGLLLIFLGHRTTIKYISFFLFGFGLLFIGLSFIKTAMEMQVKEFDFTKYAEMPLAVFLLIGFIITLLVQSSSVTMAITLSAIHAGVIGFIPAAVLVLGSETGTTIKFLLGSLGGNASKKRIALGNFLFNIFLTAGAFVFLKPIIMLITDVLNVIDPLYKLVTFSSIVNLAGIFIFLPFLNLFVKFLGKFFTESNETTVAFINHANVKEPETALDLFRKETNYFIQNSMLFNLELFKIDTSFIQVNSNLITINRKNNFNSMTPEGKYDFLKHLQGELQVFYLGLRTQVQGDQNSRLSQMISAVRSSMHSVKSIKDIRSNISNLSRSSKDIKYDFFIHHKKETEKLYIRLHAIITKEEKTPFEILQNIFNDVQNNFSSALNDFYKNAQIASIEDLDITTAINFNRELFTSNKAMLMAVKDFLLEEKQAEDFNELPVYRT